MKRAKLLEINIFLTNKFILCSLYSIKKLVMAGTLWTYRYCKDILTLRLCWYNNCKTFWRIVSLTIYPKLCYFWYLHSCCFKWELWPYLNPLGVYVLILLMCFFSKFYTLYCQLDLRLYLSFFISKATTQFVCSSDPSKKNLYSTIIKDR